MYEEFKNFLSHGAWRKIVDSFPWNCNFPVIYVFDHYFDWITRFTTAKQISMKLRLEPTEENALYEKAIQSDTQTNTLASRIITFVLYFRHEQKQLTDLKSLLTGVFCLFTYSLLLYQDGALFPNSHRTNHILIFALSPAQCVLTDILYLLHYLLLHFLPTSRDVYFPWNHSSNSTGHSMNFEIGTSYLPFRWR